MTEMNPLSAKGLSRLKAISKERLTLGSLCKLKEKLLLLTLKISTLNNFTIPLKCFTENCLILLKKYNNPLLLFFSETECPSPVDKDSYR